FLMPVSAKAWVWEPQTSIMAGLRPYLFLNSAALSCTLASNFFPNCGLEHSLRSSCIGKAPPFLYAQLCVLLVYNRHRLTRVNNNVIAHFHLRNKDDSHRYL